MAQYRPEALTQPRRSSRIQKAAAHRDPRAEPWFHTGCTSPQQLVDFEKGYERQRTRVRLAVRGDIVYNRLFYIEANNVVSSSVLVVETGNGSAVVI